MSFKVTIPSWIRTWAAQPVDPTPYREDADVARLRGGDLETPFYAPTAAFSAQMRLAEVEQVLADFAKSEGRAPSGSVLQQVSELIDRLHEQDKQSI